MTTGTSTTAHTSTITDISTTTTEYSREDKNDVTSFLNEMNIRNRLMITDSDNYETISLYDFASITNSFKYTVIFIMMPYINDNKIISIHSF